MQLLAYDIKKSIVLLFFISVGIVQCLVPNSIINDIILNVKYFLPFINLVGQKIKIKIIFLLKNININ